MATARGSKQRLAGIIETTPGVTPATPTLLEFPVTSFGRTGTNTAIRSSQIRATPFVDRLMLGQRVKDVEIGFELQPDTHDSLIESFCGQAWTSDVNAPVDALRTMTLQAQAGDLSLYDQMLGVFWTRLELNFPAAPDALVTASMTGRSMFLLWDVNTSIATTITPAPSPDPYIFGDATLKVNNATIACTGARLTLERDVDDMIILGSYNPKEEVPAMVRCSGSITVPWEVGDQSAMLTSFADASLKLTASGSGASTRSMQAQVPKMKFLSLGKRYEGRGAMFQEINWEGRYSFANGTVCVFTRT